MLANPVARVYAEALFGISEGAGTTEETLGELEGFVALVNEAPDVAEFLASPVLEPAAKVAHLKKALTGKVSDIVADFICLLTEKRRSQALPAIAQAFRSMADEKAGRTRVSVQSATGLPDSLRAEIESLLRTGLDREIVLEEEVEPALMGGAVITIGDKVYDGSVRNRLRQFRRKITRSRGYEDQG